MALDVSNQIICQFFIPCSNSLSVVKPYIMMFPKTCAVSLYCTSYKSLRFPSVSKINTLRTHLSSCFCNKTSISSNSRTCRSTVRCCLSFQVSGPSNMSLCWVRSTFCILMTMGYTNENQNWDKSKGKSWKVALIHQCYLSDVTLVPIFSLTYSASCLAAFTSPVPRDAGIHFYLVYLWLDLCHKPHHDRLVH